MADDAMTKLIRQQVKVLQHACGSHEVEDIVDTVQDHENEPGGSPAYAAGYLRACAEINDMSITELLENL